MSGVGRPRHNPVPIRVSAEPSFASRLKATRVRAETCDSCRGYVKIFRQIKGPTIDPVADDAASLGLDLLVRELRYRRGAVNPFLVGY